jgi:NMD protein affecting ribosome stability and mRNA decay
MIGTVACPWCAFQQARVSETKSKLALVYCDSCEMQSFARGAKSDRAVRTRMTPVQSTESEQEDD